MMRRGRGGFTLVETLVGVAVIAGLAAALMPALSSARESARSTVCAANLRSLQVANTAYAGDNDGRYAAGAERPIENLRRWFGSRATVNEAFMPAGGPLTPYLGGDGGSMGVRACPTFAGRLADMDDGSSSAIRFERGCGGYGYNAAFVGTRRVRDPDGRWLIADADDRLGERSTRFDHPDSVVGFADSGLAAGTAREPLIEYSFAEPRFWPESTRAEAFRADPSIHFRHGAGQPAKRMSNVVWLDTHVSAERRTFVWSSSVYEADADAAGVGWFGVSDDNLLFGG